MASWSGAKAEEDIETEEEDNDEKLIDFLEFVQCEFSESQRQSRETRQSNITEEKNGTFNVPGSLAQVLTAYNDYVKGEKRKIQGKIINHAKQEKEKYEAFSRRMIDKLDTVKKMHNDHGYVQAVATGHQEMRNMEIEEKRRLLASKKVLTKEIGDHELKIMNMRGKIGKTLSNLSKQIPDSEKPAAIVQEERTYRPPVNEHELDTRKLQKMRNDIDKKNEKDETKFSKKKQSLKEQLKTETKTLEKNLGNPEYSGSPAKIAEQVEDLFSQESKRQGRVAKQRRNIDDKINKAYLIDKHNDIIFALWTDLHIHSEQTAQNTEIPYLQTKESTELGKLEDDKVERQEKTSGMSTGKGKGADVLFEETTCISTCKQHTGYISCLRRKETSIPGQKKSYPLEKEITQLTRNILATQRGETKEIGTSTMINGQFVHRRIRELKGHCQEPQYRSQRRPKKAWSEHQWDQMHRKQYDDSTLKEKHAAKSEQFVKRQAADKQKEADHKRQQYEADVKKKAKKKAEDLKKQETAAKKEKEQAYAEKKQEETKRKVTPSEENQNKGAQSGYVSKWTAVNVEFKVKHGNREERNFSRRKSF